MATVTICSDFGAQKNILSHSVSPSICHEVMGPDAMIQYDPIQFNSWQFVGTGTMLCILVFPRVTSCEPHVMNSLYELTIVSSREVKVKVASTSDSLKKKKI